MIRLVALSAAIAAVYLFTPTDAGFFDSDCGNNKTHNFNFGTKNVFDKLFYETHVIQGSSILQKVTEDVDLPSKGQNKKGMITYIEVLDQKHDGTGGCAYIKEGGVGQDHVSIHLKSQRNKGMDFMIRVYGR